MSKVFRHGDVTLTRVAKEDARGKKREVKSHVLARGELTGHEHVLTAKEGGTITVVGSGMTNQFVTVSEEGAALTHQEHATLDIPAGTYQVGGQREFFGEKERRVID